MDYNILSVIAIIAWEAIKDGVKLTYEQLQNKLKERNFKRVQNKDCAQIADILNNIPDIYKTNIKLVEGYLETNERLLAIMSDIETEKCGCINQFSFGSGDNIGRDKIVNG